ncbi:MAG: DNA-binding protein [Planctomycetes bacterium]|nr:DNA-binding protein [Planctomycetota bacterium]
MKSKQLTHDEEATFALVFDAGEEVAGGLLAFAKEQRLTAAHFTALGAFERATLGWFNLDTKDYEEIQMNEQVEVLSLIGNVALHKNEPKVHAHVVVGKRDGTAHGGHLLKATVRPTLEVTLVETPAHLRRSVDAATGLPLIDPDPSAPPARRGRPAQ